ncbi:hypothetical protein CB0940_03547 [Cercospora beticola]|uniref:Uncharacterized protein n=1 Tax=Cercospora beticola TaxID=122368 RepID=A0A2G5I5P9_CERBT|nr:hypothetical protein CB0940_03547 [Cercospora beticola]PIB00092.1 hypothetical protein CB0940_03547 [Cercospora beticola]
MEVGRDAVDVPFDEPPQKSRRIGPKDSLHHSSPQSQTITLITLNTVHKQSQTCSAHHHNPHPKSSRSKKRLPDKPSSAWSACVLCYTSHRSQLTPSRTSSRLDE